MDGDELVKSKLITELREDLFSTKATIDIWRRCAALLAAGKSPGSRAVFAEDPVLSEEASALLREPMPPVEAEGVDNLLDTLSAYSGRRQFNDNLAKLATAVKGNDSTVDELRGLMENMVREMATAGGAEDQRIRMGSGSTEDARSFAQNLLTSGSELFPTGLAGFDSVAGGLEKGDLVVITSAPANAKTAMATNIAMNMYQNLGMGVTHFTFEVDKNQIVRRMMSRLARVHYQKVRRHSANNAAMNPAEFARVTDAWVDFDKLGQEKGGFYEIVDSPGMSATQVIAVAQSMGAEVVLIDQLTQMTDRSLKMDQWQLFGAFAQQLKAAAKKYNMIVILIAQRDRDSDLVRYSRMVEEYADVGFTWDLSEESHAGEPCEVRSIKARNVPPFKFEQVFELDYQTIRNVDGAPQTAFRKRAPDDLTGLSEEMGLMTQGGGINPNFVPPPAAHADLSMNDLDNLLNQ